jgi:hypothetical protein
MKASFYTSLFYVLSQSPAVIDLFGLPQLSPTEAKAWSALLFSSNLIYGNAAPKKLTTEDEEKKTD